MLEKSCIFLFFHYNCTREYDELSWQNRLKAMKISHKTEIVKIFRTYELFMKIAWYMIHIVQWSSNKHISSIHIPVGVVFTSYYI